MNQVFRKILKQGCQFKRILSGFLMVGLTTFSATGLQQSYSSPFPNREIEREYRAAEAKAHNLVRTDPLKGIQERQRILNWAIELFGYDHEETAVAMHNLGWAYSSAAQDDKAEPLFKQALALHIRHHGYYSINVGRSLIMVGVCYMDLGRLQLAEDYFGKAKDVATRVGDFNSVSMANYDLGEIYMEEKKFRDALNIYDEELKYRSGRWGQNSMPVASVEFNLANVYWNMGQYAKGENAVRTALGISERILGSPANGWYSTLAIILIAEGRYDEARQAAQNYFEYQDSRLGPLAFPTAEALGTLAIICAYQGERCNNAVDLMDRSCRALRQSTLSYLSGLPEPEQLSYMATSQRTLQDALSMAIMNPKDARLAEISAEWLLNGKAMLNEALAQRTLLLRDSSDPRMLPTVEQLRVVRKQISALIYTAPGEQENQKNQLQRLEDQEAVLSRQLAQSSGQRNRPAEWFNLSDLRRMIPPNSVFIDIAKVSVRNYRVRQGPADYQDHYIAWVIGRAGKSEVQVIDLGGAQAIEAGVKEFQSAMSEMDRLLLLQHGPLSAEMEKAEENKYRAASETIVSLVIEHLLPTIGSFKNWIISPDASLWAIPWGALWVRNRYIVEDHVTTYMVSGRSFLTKQLYSPTGPPLIMADPDYDLGVAEAHQHAASLTGTRSASPAGIPDRALRKFARLKRLEGTASEARMVLPSLRQYASAEPKLYLGKDALEEVFKGVHSPRVVYLATHGFFSPLPNQADKAYQFGSSLLENPLLRCGLLFASCNRTEPRGPTDDDGVLTGLEIVGTDLRGTELAILSACQTGLGDVWAGQSAAGLRQAFELAGARTVVASLWEVPDIETAWLMDTFFKNLVAKQAKGQALANSQLDSLKKRRQQRGTAHPYFWGTFILSGESQ